ncbi:MAG: hypothetical protein ACI4M5_02890 [Christensenellales bacterium]
MKITEEIKKSADVLYKIARRLDEIARENAYLELEASVDAELDTLIEQSTICTYMLQLEYGIAKKTSEPKEIIKR